MKNSIAVIVTVVILSAIGTVEDVHAQTADGLYINGSVALAMQPDDLIGGAAVGGQVGFRFPGSLLLVGEYLYAGTDYYYYDSSQGEWTMAAGWSDVPSGSSSRDDWLFYRSRHIVGAAIGASGRVGQPGSPYRIGLFGTAGFMLSIVDISDAEDYYPEFAEAAQSSSIGDSQVLFTTTLRGGLVYPAESTFAGQLAYLVQLERSDDFGEEHYFRRNSLLYLGVTVHLGGGQ